MIPIMLEQVFSRNSYDMSELFNVIASRLKIGFMISIHIKCNENYIQSFI